VGLFFVNYRKKERTLGPAAIYRELVAHFGADQVFQDYVSLRPGQMYPAGLRQALARANILITVIGPDWLTMTDEHGVRLLDRDDDWVRYEISVALTRGIVVVPVLVHGAERLEAARLPENIRRLAKAQTVEIHDRNLDEGWAKLVAECQRAGVWPPATPDTANPGPRSSWWRSHVVIVVSAMIVVAAALVILRPWEGHEGSGVAPSTNRTAPDGDSGVVRYDEPISLATGTDLDLVPPRGGGEGVDIWFDVPTQIEPGPGAVIVSWEEDSAPSRSDCANRLSGAVEDVPVVAPAAGDYVCVRTGEGRTARLRCTGLSQYGWFNFGATVWES